jgi:type VI secretion system secreted protein VgrG
VRFTERPEKKIKFDLRLADVPGLSGHMLANTSWKLTKGNEPLGLGMVDDTALIAEGQSDAAGAIKLTAAQEKALAKAWAAHPDHVWLVYPGQAVRLDVVNAKLEWSEEEKLLHALNAADFADQKFAARGEPGEPGITRYAKEALEVKEPAAIFNKIKS